MRQVLVLNQDYRAISVCSVERAFILLYLNKAETIHDYENIFLHSVTSQFPYPAVIKLNRYVNFNPKKIPLNRQNILKRDNSICQYCGTNSDLTLDHVIPKSRGGLSDWSNLITACKKCNSKKGDRTPEEAGMKMRMKPSKPSFVIFLQKKSDLSSHIWANYLKA
jgi:5-methylcytosine-specific restriction endonuclease McrA